LDRTDRCEICGRLLDAGKDIRFIFPNGDEKQLYKEHIEYIFRSLKTKEQKGYVEKELIGLKYVVIVIAILVGIALPTIFLNLTKSYPGLSGIPFLGLSLAYIVAFTTPSIYKRVLQIGILKQISVTYPKLEAKDIIQINATVIAGALILLTLLHSTPESGSSLGLGSTMASLSLCL
jgi:hypothetical protein